MPILWLGTPRFPLPAAPYHRGERVRKEHDRADRPGKAVHDADLFLHHLERGWDAWCNDWLLLAHALGENDMMMILFGCIEPEVLAAAPARNLVNGVEVILLDCTDTVRAKRLAVRPGWRGWDDESIATCVARAAALRAKPYFRIDTSDESPAESAARCVDRVARRLR
jgi:hypothetical protein